MSRQGRLSGYLVATLAAIAGVGLRWVLDPWLGQQVPFATLFGAVAVAAWWGGVAPAVWASALGYVAADYLFVEPRGGLGPSVSHLVGLAAYLTSSGIVIYCVWAMRAAQAQAEERLGHLSATITSIGDAVITTDTSGAITFLNRVAEVLTGWPTEVALGRSTRQDTADQQPVDLVRPLEDPVHA